MAAAKRKSAIFGLRPESKLVPFTDSEHDIPFCDDRLVEYYTL